MQNATVSTGILRPDIKLLKRDGQMLLFDPGADAYFKVSGKLQQTFVATGIHSLFAKPGVMSDS